MAVESTSELLLREEEARRVEAGEGRTPAARRGREADDGQQISGAAGGSTDGRPMAEARSAGARDAAPHGLLRTLTDALRGRGTDLNEAPLRDALVFLAIPMVLEMAMESVFAVVDIFFVSRLGSEAVAVVGLTESLLAVVYTVAMGLSIGVTAMVARRQGEGNPEGARLATGQALTLGLGLSLALGAVGLWQAPSLLRLMGAEEGVVALGADYARLLLGGNGVILLLFLLNAAFRGAGDAALAMRVLWLGNGLNILLDPLLIFGLGPFPELGVTGAAVATLFGRGAGVLLQLGILFRLGGKLRLAMEHLRPRAALLLRLLRLSATGTFQVLVSTASWIALTRLVAAFGSEALAGYTVAIRVVHFAILPAWGLANAASTMVGQGLGAGKPERAEGAVWMAGRMNLVFLGGLGILFLIWAPAVVGVFGVDALTAHYAVQALRVIAAGFFFYAYGMVLTAAFNGAGDAWTPTWLNLACFCGLEIPLAWYLAAVAGWGPLGVFTAIALAFSLLAVASGVLFVRGRWKEAVV